MENNNEIKEKKPQDLTRVHIQEDWELKWWADYFGATQEEIVEAVVTAGTSSEAVKEYLATKEVRTKH